MAKKRLALPLDQWPERDQALWAAANQSGGVFDPHGKAAHWTDKTRTQVLKGYGMWLDHLTRTGCLEGSASPSLRANRQTLQSYVSELEGRNLSPVTVRSRITDLTEALRVMEPESDLAHCRQLMKSLDDSAVPKRNKHARLLSPRKIYAAAKAYADETAAKEVTARRATDFRDALFLMLLAVRPIRLANLTGIRIGLHLKIDGDNGRLTFSAKETKEKAILSFPLPGELVDYLQTYIRIYRPLLARKEHSDSLWLSSRGTPMEDNSVYYRVTGLTKKLLGSPINPHLFRDCAATFVAEEAPGSVLIVTRILGHTTLETSENHYNHARSLTAQRDYVDVLDHILETDPSIFDEVI